MRSLRARALTSLFVFALVVAALVIVPALPLLYWEGWVYVAVANVCFLVITLDVLHRDPALLERRLKGGAGAETDPAQKIIQGVMSVVFVALLVVPALDHRFGWSHVAIPVVLLAEVLVVAGLAIVAAVYRANTFTAATITVESDQRVVSTGPYRFVRHPMYAGALVFVFATPLALGSVVGVAVAGMMLVGVVARLIREEQYLSEHLRGYREYRERVRYRLVPYVW